MLQIDVYSPTLERVGALFSWLSMEWREAYNTDGSFTLEVQQTTSAADILKPWNYCGIHESDTLMVIVSVQVKNKSIVATGYPAVYLFSKRISTETISNTNAESAMRGLVSKMADWPCVTLGEPAGLLDKYENQTSDGTLLDYFQKIGQAVDMGFKLRRSGKQLLFECFKPKLNANARYSDLYGNLGEYFYTISDTNAANVATVAGAGEGDARVTVVVGNTAATGVDRLEAYIDARSEQLEDGESTASYTERLKLYGQQKLVEMARIEQLEIDPQDDRAQLGDLVTVKVDALGLTAQVRVTTVTITSQKNKISKTLGVGTPIITRKRG